MENYQIIVDVSSGDMPENYGFIFNVFGNYRVDFLRSLLTNRLNGIAPPADAKLLASNFHCDVTLNKFILKRDAKYIKFDKFYAPTIQLVFSEATGSFIGIKLNEFWFINPAHNVRITPESTTMQDDEDKQFIAETVKRCIQKVLGIRRSQLNHVDSNDTTITNTTTALVDTTPPLPLLHITNRFQSMYGGNTIEQPTNGFMQNYRSLIMQTMLYETTPTMPTMPTTPKRAFTFLPVDNIPLARLYTKSQNLIELLQKFSPHTEEVLVPITGTDKTFRNPRNEEFIRKIYPNDILYVVPLQMYSCKVQLYISKMSFKDSFVYRKSTLFENASLKLLIKCGRIVGLAIANIPYYIWNKDTDTSANFLSAYPVYSPDIIYTDKFKDLLQECIKNAFIFYFKI
jgi:hypothetical protein